MPPPVRKTRRWRMVLLGLSIFFCGALTGAGTVLYLWDSAFRNTISHTDQLPPQVTDHLRKQLHLSPEQAEQVEAILKKHMRAISEIRQESYPRFAEQVEQMKEEVARVLDANQARQWREEIEQDFRLFPRPIPHDRPKQQMKHNTTTKGN